MTYAEKLRDPRWQKKRLEILERDKFTCRVCKDKTRTLHVHHIRYLKDRDPWDYKEFYLVTLCEKCHEKEEDEIKNGKPQPPKFASKLESYDPVDGFQDSAEKTRYFELKSKLREFDDSKKYDLKEVGAMLNELRAISKTLYAHRKR